MSTSTSPLNVVVEEDVWVVLLDESAGHLRHARESFVKKDTAAAAAEIQKAAAFVKVEATRAGKAVREAVLAAAGELEKLAAVVKSGAVKSVEELDAAFARAHHALAKHHCLKASEAWAGEEAHKAGHALHAAASYIDGGLKCVGHHVEAGAAKTLEGARHLAGKLISGSGKFGEEVGRSIEDCGKHTEDLGKRVASRK
jgi:hypothetical protein